jgi:hypothetical protein
MFIDKRKKEVIATIISRRIKEEIKKLDFHKIVLDELMNRNMEPEHKIKFSYSLNLNYDQQTNEIQWVIDRR